MFYQGTVTVKCALEMCRFNLILDLSSTAIAFIQNILYFFVLLRLQLNASSLFSRKCFLFDMLVSLFAYQI